MNEPEPTLTVMDFLESFLIEMGRDFYFFIKSATLYPKCWNDLSCKVFVPKGATKLKQCTVSLHRKSKEQDFLKIKNEKVVSNWMWENHNGELELYIYCKKYK